MAATTLIFLVDQNTMHRGDAVGEDDETEDNHEADNTKDGDNNKRRKTTTPKVTMNTENNDET